MLKRTGIFLLVLIGVLVAIVCTNINGYLINQLAPIDKFPEVYQFLKDRSDLEKALLMAGTIVVLGLVAALASWMVTKVPEWFNPKALPIAGLESGERMQLILSHEKDVSQRLKDTLERSAMITLDFEDASAQVQRPALDGLKKVTPIVAPARGILAQTKRFFTRGKEVDVELPPQTKMIEVFRRRDVSGRLLILGHPGAGKTTTLLELAQELLVEAREPGSKRIPYIFEMSRWTEGLSIVEYLASELKQARNLNMAVGRGIAASGDLLPLLDGLDELREPRIIAAAMEEINTYLAENVNRDAVVCCRVLDYELASKQLQGLNGAIELQPLSEPAIRKYLTDVGKGHLWALAEQSPVLVRSDNAERMPLLRMPLFLSVFAMVNPTVAVKSEGELWDAYIVKQLGIPVSNLSGKGYKPYQVFQKKTETTEEITEAPAQKQTKNYLIFMARQLQEAPKPIEVMLIERMQPTWLRSEPKVFGRSSQQWQYGLIVGLIWSLIVGPFWGLILGPSVGLVAGLVLGLTSEEIEPIEELKISILSKARREIVRYFTMGLILGLILGLVLGLIGGLWGLIFGLIGGLILGLIGGLIEGSKTELEVRSEPNQGIKASIKSMAILLPIGLIFWGLVQVKLMPYLQGFLTPVQFQRFPGTIAVVIFFMIITFGGGLAFIQHVSLRITLYFSYQKPNDPQTRCIPWNYARFLSYAADRKLLQQTGGSYRFIHRSLLEHFANMKP